jgi:CheY-like chemotaxis protein
MDGQTAGTSSGVIPLKKGKYVKIMVQDEGVGIMDEHIERLFDPYFTTKKDGAGLGLATAYSIISRHGGHIQVHSAPDEGSLFTFYLPVSVGTDAQSRETSSAMMHHRGTGKVLVMDDEVILRTVVQSLLRKAGYSTVCVENGAQALAVYRQALTDGEPFIVTIMDLTIPGGMGAKETVKKLREIDPAAKVIVYSGYTNDPAIVQYSEYGFDGVLTKPFSMEEFMRTIVTVLGKPA